MKSVLMIRAFAVAAAVVLYGGVAVHAQSKMEIVGGDTYDWGTVAPGKLQTVVQVKNVGTQELKINEVRPSCGCTAAPIDKNLLQPGEIGKISITLDVSSRSGPVEKTITITSNDSTAPVRTLHLKADVHRAITVTPMQYMLVNDGKVGVASQASAMMIKNTSDKPITIYPPELVPGGNIGVVFNLSAKRDLKPGEEFELKATVTPKEERSLYGTAKMKTTSTEMPVIDFTINGTMTQPNVPAAPSATQPSTSTQAPK